MRRLQRVIVVFGVLTAAVRLIYYLVAMMDEGSWWPWVGGSLASLWGAAKVGEKFKKIDENFRVNNRKSVAVILLCGGTGKRMNSLIPKQFLKLSGRIISLRCFETLIMHEYTSVIVVVCAEEYRNIFTREYNHLFPAWKRLVSADEVPKMLFASPAESRHASMINGWEVLLKEASKEFKLVAIHDGARPLVKSDDFTRVCNDAGEKGAAILGTPCKPTLKQIDETGSFISSTLDRSMLWEAQTPQVFTTSVLMEGLHNYSTFDPESPPTDDCMLVEGCGKVKLTKGSGSNIKITTPEDMKIAEALLSSE
jgi:2-C-methyl-D-erythritol 4-phosphate cytidylyltransferase